jgi:hypothetical protein
MLKKLPLPLIFWPLALSLASCKVTDKKITGIYVNRSNDTLTIDGQNKSFCFTDKLNKTELRHTQGTWHRIRSGISFYTFTRPTIKHHAIINKDSLSDWTCYKIYLGNTDQKIPIISGAAYLKGQIPMLLAKMHGVIDTLLIDKKDFDSLSLNTFDYETLVILKTDSINAHYTIRFYPKDNAYMIDKYFFKIRGKKLIGYLNQKRTIHFFRNKSKA